MAAFLLCAVCSPEIRIRFIERFNALNVDAPFLFVMGAYLSHVVCKAGVPVILEVILACIFVAAGAPAVCHVVRRRVREHFNYKVLVLSYSLLKNISLIVVSVPVIDHLTVLVL